MAKYFFFLLLALLLVGAWFLYQKPNVFALKSVTVHGEMKYLDKQALLNDIKPLLKGNIWKIQVGEIERVLQSESWVAMVSVKRQFPSKLRIQITERVPVGLWGNGRLVDNHYHVFLPDKLPIFEPALLQFSGQGDPRQIVEACQRMLSQLKGADMHVRACKVDERGEWSLTFVDGHDVSLGARNIAARLANLVTFWPKICHDFPNSHHLDFRYRHGFAVS